MIQRIQSIFLLASTTLIGLMLFYPLAEFPLISSGEKATFFSYGVKKMISGDDQPIIYGTLPILILTGVITLLGIITIFLYTNRTLQLRLCVYQILLLFGQIGLILFYHFRMKAYLIDIQSHSFNLPLIFPVISIILLFQAFRAIRRDDLLVKSYDRLR